MSQFIIRPQEIYLIERYSSPEYFKKLLDAFQQMLDAAERALEIFMQDLPYDDRDRHISQQPDVVWGEHVLPNFRSTLASLNLGYRQLMDGDLTALEYAGNVETDFRSQRIDYWPDWMDQESLRLFDQWQDEASKLATNICATVFQGWVTEFLSSDYSINYRGILELPLSLPVYRIRLDIVVSTGETVPQDGMYIPAINDASAQLMLKGHDAIEALVGLDEDCPQYDYEESTQWALVERIADEGGTNTVVETPNLKVLAGQVCPQSGQWWSPANNLQSRFFEKGEVFPEIENNSCGETIWYLEQSNKNKPLN